MNLARIAIKSIRQRALASSLTALSVALGVMLMVAVLVIFGVVQRTFSQRSFGYEIVIGPKGSDLQLVLSTIYRLTPAIDTLPYKYYLEIEKDPRVRDAVPITVGDFTEEGGFPIVGTTETYFTLPYAPDKKFQLRRDSEVMQDPFDAIIGNEVAETNDWTVGSQFQLVHGGAESDHVHDEKFTVVGILAPTGTPNDKTVFLHLNGFFAIAGHDKTLREVLQKDRDFFGPNADNAPLDDPEWLRTQGGRHAHHHGPMPDLHKSVSAIFVNVVRPEGAERFGASTLAILFKNEISTGLQAQAINPIQPMNTLMENFVGPTRILLSVLTGLIIVVSGVGIFVSIYNSMSDRRREIAVMRALGAQRRTVFSIILAESVILCVAGGLLGALLGHLLVFVAAPIVESYTGLLIDPLTFEPVELALLPALIALASLVGIVPGLTAYRTDVAKTLAE
ncbi:MAG: FtsX-like permease family protein [Planctomycetales bacterium]